MYKYVKVMGANAHIYFQNMCLLLYAQMYICIYTGLFLCICMFTVIIIYMYIFPSSVCWKDEDDTSIAMSTPNIQILAFNIIPH